MTSPAPLPRHDNRTARPASARRIVTEIHDRPRFTTAHWTESYKDGIAFSALRPQEEVALTECAPPGRGRPRLGHGLWPGRPRRAPRLAGYAVDVVDLSAAALERARAAHPDAAVRWLEVDVEDAEL